jgi:hypothetical protein
VPKRLYQIKDFSGGLNNLKDPADIADNEVADVSNLTFTKQGAIGGAFSMKNSTNNLLSAYDTSHIDHIEAGYGLGYFETDFVRDGIVTAQESGKSGDDNNEGSATGFIGRLVNSVRTELEYKVSGTVQNLIGSYPVGTKILLTANSFAANGLLASGQGIYNVVGVGQTDSKNLILDRAIPITIETPPQDFWHATITGFPSGDKILLLAHPDEHKIDVYSTNTAGTNWEQDSITLRSSATGVNSKVLYHKIEDSIRCFDTTDKNFSKVQWYGWIDRKHFSNDVYMGYYAKDNDLAKPTNGDCVDGGTTPAVSTYPTAGNGFDFNISTDTSKEGLIRSGDYVFAQSFIYDDNQESLLTEYSTTVNVADADDFKSFSVNVGAKSPYDPRISGGRIYIKEKDSDSEYLLLVDINLTKGCRTNLSDEYSTWHLDTGTSVDYNCPDDASASNNFIVKDLNFITYETINGYPSSIFSNALGDEGEFWKDSTVSNNRVFISNITMKDESSGSTKATAAVKNYPDRIMYSMPNRFDTFPSFNFIEAAKGDADYYTAIESFADRILAYKQYSLDIINISSPSDTNWFLEDSKNYMGVEFHGAVAKTQYGIVWVNKQGLYFYDGSQIRDLSENKIDDDTWYSFVTVNSMIIYDEATSLVYVIKNCASDGDAYVCDLKKGNFTFLKDFTHDGITNVVHTNFSDSTNALVGTDAGSSTRFYKLYRSFQLASNVSFQTKDFDFGNPARVKKIYAVYLTYQEEDDQIDGTFTLVEDDGTSHNLSGAIPQNSDGTYNTVKLTPSSPVICNKISVKMVISSETIVQINDITIEYREIYKRSG